MCRSPPDCGTDAIGGHSPSWSDCAPALHVISFEAASARALERATTAPPPAPVAAIPEPQTLLLMLAGGVAMLFLAARRRRD